MSDDNFDPTDPKNRTRAIERAKQRAVTYRKTLVDEDPADIFGYRADAEMLECLLSIAEERGLSAATSEFVGPSNDWRLAWTLEGEIVVVRPDGVDWIFRRVDGCRAASDHVDVWRADIGATVLGEPVDVTETQDEDGAYGLVWTADDHEKAANSPTAGDCAKDAHRRAAARLRELAQS